MKTVIHQDGESLTLCFSPETKEEKEVVWELASRKNEIRIYVGALTLPENLLDHADLLLRLNKSKNRFGIFSKEAQGAGLLRVKKKKG